MVFSLKNLEVKTLEDVFSAPAVISGNLRTIFLKKIPLPLTLRLQQLVKFYEVAFALPQSSNIVTDFYCFIVVFYDFTVVF